MGDLNSREFHQFVRVEFHRFKAFKRFSLELRHFNILVGPNNAGKSTILAAFRILAAAIRKATTRNPTAIRLQSGPALGYSVDLSTISVAEENIFFNYNDDEPASVTFQLSNKNTLTLLFPEQGVCFLVPDAGGREITSTKVFKKTFNCPIGFVPILGPVEHHEDLYEKEAARLALFNYRAARNFRNIWYHYPDQFEDFREALRDTWPGMDIQRPEVDMSHKKPRLHMYCPEERVPREIFWAGFGFQVWCQMLTHLIQSREVSMFLIDEPDIYLHSELQRQLVGMLRRLGPDILIATHSTEIVTEAEADELVIVSKSRNAGRRIHNAAQVSEVLSMLGSSMNPILTQLGKTRRALFVEGKDFQVLGKCAKRMKYDRVGNRGDFAVVPIEGFNVDRIRTLKAGIEATLGASIVVSAILDGDFRSRAERRWIERECEKFCDFVKILDRKEVENFLLVPSAIDRAARARLADRVRRTGMEREYEDCAELALDKFAAGKEHYVSSQMMSARKAFERAVASTEHESKIMQVHLEEFEKAWAVRESRLELVPGKDALAAMNIYLQEKYGISITATGIIDSMRLDEMPRELREIVEMLAEFAKAKPGGD